MVPKSQDNQIAFRRIRGRIVPIKIKHQGAEIAKGSALVAAGVATGSAAGAAYRAVNAASTRASSRAFRSLERITAFGGARQGSFFSMMSKQKAQAKAMDALNKARRIGKFAAPLRLGGQVASAALIGVGATKIYKGITGKEISSEKASAIGSTVGLGAFLTGSYGGAGFRASIKPLYVAAYPHIRKFKSVFRL